MKSKIVVFPEASINTINWREAEDSSAGIVLAFNGDSLLGSIQFTDNKGYTLNVSVGGLEKFIGYNIEDSLEDIYHRMKEKYPDVVFKFFEIDEYLSDPSL